VQRHGHGLVFAFALRSTRLYYIVLRSPGENNVANNDLSQVESVDKAIKRREPIVLGRFYGGVLAGVRCPIPARRIRESDKTAKL
jgi:hypothetical protein